MLETLRRRLKDKKPVYGMHRGTVGFLMNEFRRGRAAGARWRRPSRCVSARSWPSAKPRRGIVEERAFNEVSLFRQTAQIGEAAHQHRWRRCACPSFLCDGLMVATPGGLHRLQLLRPWPDPADQLAAAGADADQRLPAAPLARRAAAAPRRSAHRSAGGRAAPLGERGLRQCRNPRCHWPLKSAKTPSAALTLLFDPGHALDERIVREQFNV